MNVKGMSIRDIMNLTDVELSKMSAREIKAVTNRLASSANKRIRRLKESGLASRSSAYRGLRAGIKHKGKIRMFTTDYKKLKIKEMKGHKGKFPSAKGKLYKEFNRAVRFLNDKTSTIAGTKDVMKKVKQRLGEFKSKAQENRFWEAYNALQKDYGDLVKGRRISTDEIQQMIYERQFPNGKRKETDIDSVIENMRKELERKYVKSEESQPEETPFSIRYEKVKLF